MDSNSSKAVEASTTFASDNISIALEPSNFKLSFQTIQKVISSYKRSNIKSYQRFKKSMVDSESPALSCLIGLMG